MPEITFTIILFYSFPEAMVLVLLSLSLLGIRPGFRKILLIGGIQALFDVLLFLVVGKLIAIPFGVHTVAQIAAMAMIIRRVMRFPYQDSCLAVLFGFSIYLCIETLMYPAMIFIIKDFVPSVVSPDNWWQRLPMFIMQLMITLLVAFLIYRFNIRFMSGWKRKTGNSLFLLASLMLVQSILMLWLGLQYYIDDKNHANFGIPIHFSFVLMNTAIPVITLMVIKQCMEFIRNEVETQAQLDNLRHIEELLNTMRVQRHNFTHELQVIYGLLEVQAFQEARDYLKKSVNEVAATSELVRTDNLGVTALLHTKAGLAEARSIDLHITVKTSLRQLPLEVRDVNLILGNLIDNAMEAVAQLPVPERKVEVMIGQDLRGFVVEVNNSGSPISPEVSAKIFMPGFSTKGEGRGMGLYSVQTLVHKYNGDIQAESDGNGTSFRVVIPG
ncbi:sensor histidine kinase [Acetonema longum]|uniref:histidine kinase n=1 Tax=Acetonema longum DSM 6540 TaxID=1009370 RepID=F7NLA2_9FIRM|nr:ATP-binding protein [Acetonema longum]EGO63207.1 signal transduction histidine kinase regulating citrate/malate metabolism [Acetonema longum DSM 6540]